MWVIKTPEVDGYWSLYCCSDDLTRIKEENQKVQGIVEFRDIKFSLDGLSQIWMAETYIREDDIGCDSGNYFRTFEETKKFVDAFNTNKNIYYITTPLRVI